MGPRTLRRSFGGRAGIALLVGMVVLIAVVMLVAAGCGSDTETTTSRAAETTTTEEVTTTVADSSTTTSLLLETTTTVEAEATTTTEPLSSAEILLPSGNIKAMGYIDRVWESGGKRYISIDYAEMLTGEEAIDAAIEDGYIGPGEDVPNDYYIVNVNPLKREFTVSASASIVVSTILGGSMDDPITWAVFKSYWSDSPPTDARHMHKMPWWIERSGTEVISIAEQYLP